jgi:hypothetical protein
MKLQKFLISRTNATNITIGEKISEIRNGRTDLCEVGCGYCCTDEDRRYQHGITKL